MQAWLGLHFGAKGREEENFPENSSPQSFNLVSIFKLHIKQIPNSKDNLNCLQMIEHYEIIPPEQDETE